jgi:hypothetical protein
MLYCHGDDLVQTFRDERTGNNDRSIQASFSLDIVDMLYDLPVPGPSAVAALPAADCGLVTLAAQLESALELGRAAGRAQDERQHSVAAAIDIPEALRFQEADRPMLARLGIEPPQSGVFDHPEIITLRQVSPLAGSAEYQRARAIVAAHDQHLADVDKARAAAGIGNPNEELEKIVEPLDALRDAIADTPATTLAGLAAKAIAACGHFDAGMSLDEPDETVCRSQLADLLRVAGRLPPDGAATAIVTSHGVDVVSDGTPPRAAAA